MKKIVGMTIAAVVVIVLITSMVIPVVESGQGIISSDKKVNFSNEGTPLAMGDVTEDYTMTWDSALPGMMKVNGDVTTVYFVAGSDATVSPTSKNVTVDLTYGDLPVPVRNGYTFAGWFTSTQYTTEVTENTIVEGKTDKTLYAKWTPNTYTVTFDADGGTVSPATKTVTMGQAYGELPVPEYYGHIFGGWFDSNDNPITATTVFTAADDVTLTAVWTLDSYLVSFTTDGNGTVDVQSITVDYGTAYTISGNTVTIGSTVITATPNTNYIFDHWTPSTSGTIEGATTFTANFNLPPVTITFTAQSPGTVSSASISDVPRGTQYVVADNVVTITGFTPVTASLPDGYYMTGWNVAQGVGTITGEMTFTAEYEMIEIASVSCSNHTTWVVTTDGKLFGCGSNISGQQGDGTTTNVTTFTQRLSDQTIASVSCSENSTWAVTTDGKLFGCGSNISGQQGDGTTTNVTTFTQCLSDQTIASVSCAGNNTTGRGTTWAVTTDGKLFGCGNNLGGQQGDGTTTDVTTFTQRLSDQTIASVKCNLNTNSQGSTWAVTTDGKLFRCGSNYGNLGTGGSSDLRTFTQVLNGESIKSVEASPNSTWAVTTDGKLFGCGNNQGGQQGDGTTTNVTTFTQRLSDQTIASVCNGIATVWAVTTDGKLFGCGKNGSGQQGDGTTTNVTTFTQRLSDQTIASVSCAGNNTTGIGTTWAVTTDGKLFGCGANESGQQGSGGTGSVTTFTQRGPPGSVNISTPSVIPHAINPIHLNPNLPFTPVPLVLNSISPSDITGTDYTFHAGGNDWMLATVSVGQDQYALALYYVGLTAPLLWDEDVTMTFSNGSLTVENGGNTYTMDYTTIFYKDSKGTYVLNDGTGGYVKNDTTIIGYSIPVSGSGIEVTGTPSSLTAMSIADGSITVSGTGAIVTADTDYDDVKSFSEISATYDTDGKAICTSVILPKTVTVITPSDNNTLDDLLSVIPLFLILGTLVMFVTAMFVMRRA